MKNLGTVLSEEEQKTDLEKLTYIMLKSDRETYRMTGTNETNDTNHDSQQEANLPKRQQELTALLVIYFSVTMSSLKEHLCYTSSVGSWAPNPWKELN